MMFPLKRHGSYAFCLSPMLARNLRILSYQCFGLHLRPYKVRLSNQYSFFFSIGVPDQGFDDSYLVRGKDTLAEGVFAVTLF